MQDFFSNDDYKLLRKHMWELAVEASETAKHGLSVLEVGPSLAKYTEQAFPEYSTCVLKRRCAEANINYKTLDIIPGTCDYTGTIEDLTSSLGNDKFDIIVALGVIEHTFNIFKIPDSMCRVLNAGGRVYLNTPFLFKLHSPTPDYWRISPAAMEKLFGDLFNLTIDTYPKDQVGKNSKPLSINISGIKK